MPGEDLFTVLQRVLVGIFGGSQLSFECEENTCDAFSSQESGPVSARVACMEFFLFFMTILQKFSLRSLVEPRDLDIKPLAIGLINMPPPYKLSLVPR